MASGSDQSTPGCSYSFEPEPTSDDENNDVSSDDTGV